MSYKILADIVVFVHFLWILFLVFGGLIGVRFRTVKVLHISGLIFAFAIQVFDWYCPLTHLEVWLRSKHDPTLAYAGSFIVHYVEKLVYFQLSRSLVFILTLLVCGFNVWIYLRKRRKPGPGLP